MASVSGQVGHHGKHGCRLYCPLTGRHKPGAPHYYPGLQKPDDYHVEGCDHDDIELLDLMKQFSPESARERYTQNLRTVEKSRNQTNFEKNRLETGICKPTIFSGLPATRRLAIPSLFPGDNMHLPCLNITDLFIPLWRGKLDCDTVRGDNRASWDWVVLTGDVWKEHGRRVAAATPYLPGSFDRPPRNPAEKISSGYKAWEFLLYFYGLGPALLHGILPEKFYRHYCKGVRGLRMMLQEAITVEEVLEADRYLSEFCSEYEDLYIQRKASRLHFSRQSMHIPAHMPHEVLRCGPGGIYSQWVMERTIGNLGEEIKQHSDAFSNLGQRALRRCQVNALKSIYPDLDDTHDLDLPRNAVDLGGGYAFLPACDTAAREIAPQEMLAIHAYMHQHGVNDPRCLQIVRWARLHLPNGQIGRTSWKESVKPFDTVRASRHVKFVQDQQDGGGSNKKIAEILYFVLLDIGGHQHPIAVAQQFGLPDADLMDLSYETYYTAPHLGDAGLVVFNAKSIESVVMMAPDEGYSQAQNYWYLMEKPGLTLISSTFGAAGIGEEEN